MNPFVMAYEWFVCLCESFAAFILLKSKFECRKLLPALLAVPVIATAVFVMNLNSVPWALMSVIGVIMYTAYAFICFRGSNALKCIWGPTPILISCLSNFVFLVLFNLIAGWGEASLTAGNTFRIVGQLIYLAIIYAIIIPLTFIKSRDGRLPSILRAISILLSMIGVAASMHCFSLITSQQSSLDTTTASAVLCGAILAISIALMVLSGYLSKLYLKSLEMQKELQQSKLEAEHLSQVGAMYEYVREWRHDMKGILSAAEGMINSGNTEAASEYLGKIGEEVGMASTIVSTGNPAFDAAVSSKLILAKRHETEVDCTITVSEDQRLNEPDVCSLIMNLMDNAIEASGKLVKEERWIQLGIVFQGEMLKINVKNSCSGEYRFDGKRLMTTKDDMQVHGIGIKRIEHICGDHNGCVRFEPKEHSFEASVLLNLGNRAK